MKDFMTEREKHEAEIEEKKQQMMDFHGARISVFDYEQMRESKRLQSLTKEEQKQYLHQKEVKKDKEIELREFRKTEAKRYYQLNQEAAQPRVAEDGTVLRTIRHKYATEEMTSWLAKYDERQMQKKMNVEPRIDYENMSVSEFAKRRVSTKVNTMKQSFSKRLDSVLNKTNAAKTYVSAKKEVTVEKSKDVGRWAQAFSSVARADINRVAVNPTKKKLSEYTSETSSRINKNATKLADNYHEKRADISNYITHTKNMVNQKVRAVKIGMLKLSSLSGQAKLNLSNKPLPFVANRAMALTAQNISGKFRKKFEKHISQPFQSKSEKTRSMFTNFRQRVVERKAELDRSASRDFTL